MKVAIFLCVYNGQRFLLPQLDSIISQTYRNWELHVSDDGSQDETLALLEQYQNQVEKTRFHIHSGPRKGFVANFLSLCQNPTINAEYFAFSDQDDIWQTDKIEKAVNWLKTVSAHVPALYCTRTQLINENNEHIGYSHLYLKSPTFANALVQNISGGNTMVFNQAARTLLNKAGSNVSFHDWLLYQVVTGCGGKVFYDSYPSVCYRQHGSNITGAGFNWSARFLRIRMMMQGCFKSRNDQNIQALLRLEAELTPENRELLHQFAVARKRKLFSRLIGIKQSGIYRQTTFGNLGLFIATLFNKI